MRRDTWSPFRVVQRKATRARIRTAIFGQHRVAYMLTKMRADQEMVVFPETAGNERTTRLQEVPRVRGHPTNVDLYQFDGSICTLSRAPFHVETGFSWACLR